MSKINNKRRIQSLLLSGIILLPFSQLVSGEAVSLPDQIRKIADRHPAVSAARMQTESASASVKSGLSPEDPEVMIARSESSMNEITAGMDSAGFMKSGTVTEEVRVTQKVPFYGKNIFRYNALSAAAGAAEIRQQMRKNEVIAGFLLSAAVLHESRENLKITRIFRNRSLVFSEVMSERFRAGRVSLADVSRAKLLAASYNEKSKEYSRQSIAAERNLEYFSQDPVSESSFRELSELVNQVSGFILSDSFTPEKSMEQSLSLKAAEYASAEAKARKREKYADYFPDVAVFLGTGRSRTTGSGTGFAKTSESMVTAGVSFRVPVWSLMFDANQAGSASAASEASFHELSSVKERVSSDIKKIKESIRLRKERIKILKTELLPAASLARDSLLSSYEAGRAEFTALLNAWEDLYRVQILIHEQEKELAAEVFSAAAEFSLFEEVLK